MTVLLLDDHALFRQSLARILRPQFPTWAFTEAGNKDEALAAMDSSEVSLLLLDLSLGKVSGLSVLPDLRAKVPGLKVLIVSMHQDGQHVAAALKARVQGFVGKDAPVDLLIEAVEALAADRTWFAPQHLDEAAGVLSGSSGLDDTFADYRSLTGREQEVFLLLAEGRTVPEIGKALGRSQKTVENHRSNLYQKLGLADRHELFALARRLGLIL